MARPLREGTILYRARTHTPGAIPMIASELGPPSADKARNGRMSRQGDPIFYGAYDSATAVAEVAKPGDLGTVARFRLLRDARVVDLADIAVPSLFDADGRAIRSARLFLNGFAADISQPAAWSMTTNRHSRSPTVFAKTSRTWMGSSTGLPETRR